MTTTKLSQKDMVIGKRIKRYRHKMGLTQEQLAEKIHVSTTHVGLVETGYRRMSLKTLQKTANVLGIKMRHLLPY